MTFMIAGEEMPMVDCHRHLGGSIPCRFVWYAIKSMDLMYLAESLGDVHECMTFAEDEPRDFHRFLHKFEILDHIKWSAELIQESIREVCQDLIDEGVDYTLMRFSINKYMTHLDWHRRDVIKFIADCFEEYAPGRVGLVLSLKYESERANQRQLSSLVVDDRVADSIIGIDLVGDEAYYDSGFYAHILKPWADAGKILFAHVGESQDASNVMTAMTEIGVKDICHGIKAIRHPDIIQCAKDNDVCFHMALTSNLLTGVLWDDNHPIYEFLREGVLVTIGTDDPVQCSTSIGKEYSLLRQFLTSRAPYLGYHGIEEQLYKVAISAVNRVRKYNLTDWLPVSS